MLKSMMEMDQASAVFKLLGHETRLTMLKIMEDHDCCVCEFVEIFQASQPSISQHLRKLRDFGLIKEERRGQWIYYSINKASECYSFLEQLLLLLPEQEDKLTALEEKGTRKTCE